MTTHTNSHARYLQAIESGVYAEESTPFGTAADELTQARYTIHDDCDSKLGRPRLGAVTKGDPTGGFEPGQKVTLSPNATADAYVAMQKRTIRHPAAGHTLSVRRVVNDDLQFDRYQLAIEVENNAGSWLVPGDWLCFA